MAAAKWKTAILVNLAMVVEQANEQVQKQQDQSYH
jgi:hypothetical protein